MVFEQHAIKISLSLATYTSRPCGGLSSVCSAGTSRVKTKTSLNSSSLMKSESLPPMSRMSAGFRNFGIIPTYVSSFTDCGVVKEYNRARMKLTNCLHPISILVLAACSQVHAQAPQPNGGGVRSGTLPRAWQVSGPRCGDNPQFQVQELRGL